jgi:hypothetical protein
MTTQQAPRIELGKTVELGTVRIHRFADHFRVIDLTNAGKRGKRVRVAALSPTGFYPGDRVAWADHMGGALLSMCASFDEVRRLVSDLLVDYPGELRFEVLEARGVDIEPAGAQSITLKTSGGLEIKASERDFQVCSRQFHGATATHPGVAHDTLYWPAGTKTVARAGAASFFAWLSANLSAIEAMTIGELRSQWEALGVRYDFH